MTGGTLSDCPNRGTDCFTCVNSIGSRPTAPFGQRLATDMELNENLLLSGIQPVGMVELRC